MSPDLLKPPYAAPGMIRLDDSEERTDVATLHAAVLREQAEPKEGQEPLSLWLVALMSALLFWGGFYLQRYSGGYQPFEYDENASGAPPVVAAAAGPEDAFTKGKRIFSTTCGACHKEDGQGVPGQFPPLAGSEWVQAKDPGLIIRIVLDGLIGPVKVRGTEFNNPAGMVKWRKDQTTGITDEEIAAVLTYVRGQKEWGNNAEPVTPELVKQINEATTNHAGTQWTIEQLQKAVAAPSPPPAAKP